MVSPEKAYDPKAVESRCFQIWSEGDYFRPEHRPDGPSFTITIPPPNVTGELHMGHALQHALHDTIVRWKRMQGYRTLCLPGTDHAGIATQMKVEDQLFRETGKTRHDVGREAMLDRVRAWKDRYGSTILRQLQELGCSYDWSRERFTMDPNYAKAVLEAFVQFHRRGWIYRGRRIVNWCPRCGSVISDLEVEERETRGHLWHVRYPGVGGGPDVTVATTRPETMLGDSGVAVHPADDRWRAAIGGRVRLPLADREIPIVADEAVDPELGSGAVKVTPAHDPNDYEIGRRHALEEIEVIGPDGTMTAEAGRFSGLDRSACRSAVVETLARLGLVDKVDDHLHAVPHHDKCGTVVEPLLMEQWFVSMRKLADQALPVLRNADIRYVPDRFRSYSVDWLENIRDWCISRQIWWGHRIPVWTHRTTGEVRVQVSEPDGAGEWEQDPDVLDTWFSSALWPFATLGWPDQTDDMRRHFPTDLMITGRDILYLWVARMVMTSVEFTDAIPFKTVLVHPTVQTRDGRRMSKSLGTGVDPRELIERYGADATRLSLLHQCGASQDIRFDAEVKDNVVQASAITEACRNFCNKLWNAARFVQMNTDGSVPMGLPARPEDLADRWILSRFNRTITTVSLALADYRFDEASRALYEFVWNTYCDWYVELAKVRLSGDDPQAKSAAQSVLVHVLEGTLRLLHPMVPFITEALWQSIPHRGCALIAANWPEVDDSRRDDQAESEMDLIQGVIGAVRNIRGAMRVPPGRHAEVVLKVDDDRLRRVLERGAPFIRAVARVSLLTIGPCVVRPAASGTALLPGMEVYVPLSGLIDLDVERGRQMKEAARVEKVLSSLESRLSSAQFLQNAPPEVVEGERRKKDDYEQNLERLRQTLASLN